MIRADSGLMLLKSRDSAPRDVSAIAPANSTPMGPPPTIANVRRCVRTLGLTKFNFGTFERQQYATSDLDRVLDALEPGSQRSPLLVSEVRVGRDHEIIEGSIALRPSARAVPPDSRMTIPITTRTFS